MTPAMKVLIVDDEPLARRGLRIRLSEFDDVDVQGECGSGREALAICRTSPPDVLFLDIQMPGMDGFDVIQALQGDAMPVVIFVTAFDQYAVSAFEANAVDYLLKPVEQARLAVAMDKARASLQASQAITEKGRLLSVIGQLTGRTMEEVGQMDTLASPLTPPTVERLAIKDGETTTLVALDDIDWVEAAGDYMCLHAGDVVHILRSTMRQLAQRLPDPPFCRIHRSTLVNANRVEQIDSLTNGEYLLTLKNGTQIKSGRGYKQRIRQWL